MFNVRKLGAAVAFAALTAFAASGANATVFLPGDPLIPSPNFTDVFVFTNGTGDLVPGGDLVAGAGFDGIDSDTGSAFTGLGNTFSFTIDASINPPGTNLPIRYQFSVEAINGGVLGNVGIANLEFQVFQNNVLVNTIPFTDGDGFTVAGQPAPFSPTFLDGDVIDWVVTGTVLGAGGGYAITVAAVPLPASVLMLIGALAGLGFVGRMKKKRFAAA